GNPAGCDEWRSIRWHAPHHQGRRVWRFRHAGGGGGAADRKPGGGSAAVNVRDWGLPFRVGATSYVVEDDLLPNARYLAPIVQDMQLVLFDLPGGPSNLPDAATV